MHPLVAEKVQGFKAWWDELFDKELAFWSMHHPNFPADERRWPQSAHWAIPMQQAEGPTSIQRITNPEYLDASHLRPGQWDDTLVGEALQALTKSQDDLPPGVAAPEQTHTLVWLGNDKPLHKELYRPEQDLEDGDIALVLYEPQNTPQEQGWEIVKVTEVNHEHNTFEHVLLCPNRNQVYSSNGTWLSMCRSNVGNPMDLGPRGLLTSTPPGLPGRTYSLIADTRNPRAPYKATDGDIQCVIWSLRTSTASRLRIPKASWTPLLDNIELANRL